MWFSSRLNYSLNTEKHSLTAICAAKNVLRKSLINLLLLILLTDFSTVLLAMAARALEGWLNLYRLRQHPVVRSFFDEYVTMRCLLRAPG